MAIENFNTIDERRSKIARTLFLVFGPHSSIVKSVFDCPLSVVMLFVDPCDQGVGSRLGGRFVQSGWSHTFIECQWGIY